MRLLLVKFFQQCNHPTLQTENWQLYHNIQLHVFTFHFFKRKLPVFLYNSEVFIPVVPVPYLESLLTTLSQRQLKQKEGRNGFFPQYVTQLNLTFLGMDKQRPETTLTISKTTTASSSSNNNKNPVVPSDTKHSTHMLTHPHTLSLLSWTLTAGTTS